MSSTKQVSTILVIVALVTSTFSQVKCQENSTNSDVDPISAEEQKQENLLKQPERITVVAPKYLRPQSDYFVLVTLANSRVPASVDLQLTGARDSNREQTEARSVLVQPGETQTIKFAVGQDWPSAEYFLSVNAQAVDRSWQFQQEAPVNYHEKSYTGLVQSDKAIYKPGEIVHFRAIFLTESLAPFSLKDEINVTISDPKRNVIRQWRRLSNWRGLLTLELQLSDDPMLGDWTIQVEARGQQFGKKFQVAEYVLPSYDVQVQLPAYATYNDSRVVASVRATYTYGKPVSGHVTLTVQPLVRFSYIDTRPLEQWQHRARLSDGKADFEVDLASHLRDQADLFEREIEFFALVEEDLTGRKYNRTNTLKVYSRPVKIERIAGPDQERSFKPGLSQLYQYKVAYQDDTPVEDNGELVSLEYSHFGKLIGEFKLRPQGGVIEHELVVPHKITRPSERLINRSKEFQGGQEREFTPEWLNVQALYRGQKHYLDQLQGFKSASNNYMQIELPQLERRAANKRAQVKLGDQVNIRIKSTEPMGQVNCQALARGNIVWALSPDAKNKTQFEFQVQVGQQMAPEARILCFYVRPDNKELIVDSVRVPVGGFMRNFVKLSPSTMQAKPGEQIEVGVFTKPNSLLGVLAIDQSVLLLKSGNDISARDVLDEHAKFEAGETIAHLAAPRDAVDLFDRANLVVLTNNRIEKQKSAGLMYHSPRGSSNLIMFKVVPELAYNIMPVEFHLANKQQEQEQNVIIRSVFPETWLWQNGTADEQGKASFSAKIPDTITSWQLSAFSLSEAHGLGLAPGQLDDGRAPTTIRVFRPFFVKLNLPYSVIRGETLAIQAIVFNYSKRPTQAKVTLDNSRQDFEFVEAANSIEDEVRSNGTSESHLVRVPPEQGASVSFLLRPLKLGHLDVKVIAQGELAGDGVVRKLLVKPEGQVQHFNRAMLLRLPQPDGSTRFKRNVTIEMPANAVADSQRVHVSAIGDILGAGLANVDDLLRLPYGCGEQNMINLVPNIVIYNYLKSSGRLRDAQRQRALRNIETGYQRQLNYKRSDGSFSAFGQQDANGSVWLTAYVLKTLKQAAPLISVDPKVVRRAAQFVAHHAQPDGTFSELGMLHNKQLASNSKSSAYLSAYATGALLEDNSNTWNSSEERETIERGLAFLERHLEASDDVYELAIIAHTLQLARSESAAQRAYDKLWSRARQHDDQTWWTTASASAPSEETRADLKDSDDQVETLPKKPVMPPLKPPLVQANQSAHLFTPDSLSIEATSLALLTTVRRGDLERALPIARWLIGQQNSCGGFASTQDTVLAIEALATFAQASGQTQAPLALDVQFQYPRVKRSSQFRKTDSEQLSLTQSNALVQQQVRLDESPAWVQVQASGVGVAVVQVSWQYNLLVSAEEPAFYLNPILDKTSTINYLQLSVCTFYRAGESSNMAVVDVELPSGYVADAEALPGLKRNKAIKRVDTADGETRVLVYLDKVTRHEELCFTVPAHRSTKVSNNKPVPVTIYDYYERNKAARIFYKPQPASSCDICEPDTCSEQCHNKPKRLDKLVSLHEQRRQSGRLTALKPSNATLADLKQQDNNNNSTIPSASELLPLKPVLDSLKNALTRPPT